MKKCILLFVGLLVVSGVIANVASAQQGVIANFNTPGNINGIEKGSDSGPGLDSLYQTTDPTDPTHSNGVLAMHFSFDSTTWHGRMEFGTIGNATYLASNGAQFLTFWVYLDSAQHIPDSLKIDTYAMPNVTWDWTEDTHYAKDIPKNVWYPLTFPLAEHMARDTNFNIIAHQFMTGLQMQPIGQTWHGTIYVDNISLVGPYVPSDLLAGFNTAGSIDGIEKGSDSGPGLDSLYQTADPTDPTHTNGVLAMHFSFDSTTWHGRMEFGTIGNATYLAANGAQFITFWVYLDTAQHIPDSLKIDTYAMPNVTWDWTEDTHYAKDIPKNVWYPLTFPLAEHMARDTNFNIVAHQFMTGLQMQPIGQTWHGTILVDKIAFSGTTFSLPPSVWTAADFENGKRRGFYVPPFGCATLSVIPDNKTSNGTYVLQAAVNLAQVAHRFTVLRDSVPMKAVTNDSSATDISIDVYLPNKMPNNGVIKLYISAGASDSVSVVDTIKAGGLVTNGWNTLWIHKLDSLKTAGKFDPTKKPTLGLVLSYPNDTSTWAGNIYIDNLMIHGFAIAGQLGDITTGIAGSGNVVKVFELYHNYPNPFNPSTVIKYDLPVQSKVLIQVFDILGRQVETLVNDVKAPGSYEVKFNASNRASGVYFVRMNAGSFTKTQKIMLLK